MLLPPYWQMFSCSLVLTCDVTIGLRRFVSLYCFHGAGFDAAGFVALTFPPTAIWLMASFRIVSTIVSSDSISGDDCQSLSRSQMFCCSKAVRPKGSLYFLRPKNAHLPRCDVSDPTLKFLSWRVDLSVVAAILPFNVLLYELSAS